MTPIALSIAGSDPSGGAGIQADLKTFHAHGVYGQAVVSLLTVQSPRSVRRVSAVPADWIRDQLAALWEDMPPQAAKTGALPTSEAVLAVAASFRGRACPLVVDPVVRPTEGAALGSDELLLTVRAELMPVATLITPNVPEAEALTGLLIEDVGGMMRAGQALLKLGAHAVLVKGGHLAGEAIDVLVIEDGTEMVLRAPRIATPHTHGTGCTYSAAICAQLALGRDLPSAVRRAKWWLTRVLESPLSLEGPRGPLNHFVAVRDS